MANEKRRLIDIMRIDLDDVDISDCTDVDDIFAKIEDLLDAQPIVDAVPVVHGRWILTGEAEMSCSVCDDKYYGEWDYECMTPYCPNCGAKMDGGNEDVNLQ